MTCSHVLLLEFLPSRGYHSLRRCEAGILTGGPERERKKYLVSVFSISAQTDSDHQCSTKTTYPNNQDGKSDSC